MKIRILIADSDIDYLEHLSQALTESYAETFEVTTISAIAKVDIFDQRSFEVALLAPRPICNRSGLMLSKFKNISGYPLWQEKYCDSMLLSLIGVMYQMAVTPR